MYKVLIIGLGQIGMLYDFELEKKYIFSHARAFTENKMFSVIAAVDIDKEKRDKFSQVYNRYVYETIEEAVDQHNFDVVVISVITEAHYQVFLKLVTLCRPKIILCEKPMSYNHFLAKEMITICATHHIKLFVNYMRLANKKLIEIKKDISLWRMSKPLKGIVWYTKGLINNGSHILNLLEYWLGSVTSSKVIREGRNISQFDCERDVLFKFGDSEILFLSWMEEFYSHYSIELLSEFGSLRYDCYYEEIEWKSSVEDSLHPKYRCLNKVPSVEKLNRETMQLEVVGEIVKALQGAEVNLCSGRQAFETLKSLNLIMK